MPLLRFAAWFLWMTPFEAALAARGARGGVGLGAVAGGDGVLHATGRGLELAFDRAVAHAGLLVGDDALLLAFDVRHG